MQFQGTEQYVATEDLKMAVNAAIALQRPLLIKGEPGTGKTLLAEQASLRSENDDVEERWLGLQEEMEVLEAEMDGA